MQTVGKLVGEPVHEQKIGIGTGFQIGAQGIECRGPSPGAFRQHCQQTEGSGYKTSPDQCIDLFETVVAKMKQHIA